MFSDEAVNTFCNNKIRKPPLFKSSSEVREAATVQNESMTHPAIRHIHEAQSFGQCAAGVQQSCKVQLGIPLVPAMLQVCLSPAENAEMFLPWNTAATKRHRAESHGLVEVTHHFQHMYREGFPGVFLPVTLNNQASGLLFFGGAWYHQAVPAACKSLEITLSRKQKIIPSIQSLQVMVWQRLFWATDLHWGFSSQKTVNRWRGRRQHSLKKKKKTSMRYRHSCLKALSQYTQHKSQLLL